MLYVLPMRVFFVLIFLLPVVYFTQSRSLINFTDEDGLKQGDWKVRYENSQFTRYIGQFKDGTPIGEFKYYYPNGLLSAIVNFSGSKDLIGQIIDVNITGSNRNSLDGAL